MTKETEGIKKKKKHTFLAYFQMQKMRKSN